jgi:large subunit ribosomal protein L12
MNYVYAALLLHSAGKPIDEKSLKDVLSAAGINPDESRVKALVAALSEIDIDEALKAAVSAPAPAPAAAPAPAQPAEEKPKVEKKEKPKEEKEEALEGLGALFG